MATVLLVIHLMVAAALVGLVLLQRSEGGALGIGGGGGGGVGGFMTGRGTANLLTRVTAVLAAAFFCTSILLTLIAKQASGPGTRLEGFTIDGTQETPQSGSPIEGFQLPPKPPSGPQVPQSQ
ncbi:MAG: preprotein translocase subunit SecG [Proteobacteria bacterium]|nr:preprotein translocase subunit SecG [Pseudomonadota bacterium]